MIKTRNSITGKLNSRKQITAKLNYSVHEITPDLENLEITPSDVEQVFKSENYYGYDEVKVKAIDVESLDIEENAVMTLDAVPNNTQTTQVISIRILKQFIKKIPKIDTSNWVSMAHIFMYCTNLVELPLLNTSKVTNMTYAFNACENLTEFPLLDMSNVTITTYMFNNCKKLEKIPLLNISNVTEASYMFSGCSSLIEIPQLNTSNIITAASMFSVCSNLITIPCLDFGNVQNINSLLYNCKQLINFGGFKDLGKSYINATVNYGPQKLSLAQSTLLTHESLMNVINNLYDLNLTYNVANGGTLHTQSLQLGSTNLAKLTPEEIAIATAKGWTVS